MVGLEGIRKFWWPPNTSPATITNLELTADGASVDGEVGTLWGRFVLGFSFESEGRERSVRNAGTYLMVLRRDGGGEWRITHRMWDDPVAQAD